MKNRTIFMISNLGLLLAAHSWAEQSALYNSRYTVSRGNTMSIELDSNATTGYRWEVANSAPEIVEIVDQGNKGPQKKDKNLVGAPGKQWWKIKGLKKGTAELTFSYRRSWEKDQAPADTKKMLIIVK